MCPTPDMIMASSVVSPSSSGEPPKPTVKSHCSASHALHPYTSKVHHQKVLHTTTTQNLTCMLWSCGRYTQQNKICRFTDKGNPSSGEHSDNLHQAETKTPAVEHHGSFLAQLVCTFSTASKTPVLREPGAVNVVHACAVALTKGQVLMTSGTA